MDKKAMIILLDVIRKTGEAVILISEQLTEIHEKLDKIEQNTKKPEYRTGPRQ